MQSICNLIPMLHLICNSLGIFCFKISICKAWPMTMLTRKLPLLHRQSMLLIFLKRGFSSCFIIVGLLLSLLRGRQVVSFFNWCGSLCSFQFSDNVPENETPGCFTLIILLKALIRLLLQKESYLGLRCLSRPFLQTSVRNLRASTVECEQLPNKLRMNREFWPF